MTVREEVDAALNRVLCQLALRTGDGPLAGEEDLAALAVRVRSLGSEALERLVEEALASTDCNALERSLARFSAAWSVWPTGGDAAAEAAALCVEPDQVCAAGEEPPSCTEAADADVEALRADPEMAAMFISEALDQLCTIEASVLRLEESPGDLTLLNDIFRPFHTVKGNALAIGVRRVGELAHKVENLLDLCRSGRHALGALEIDAVLEAVDVLTALIVDAQARLNGEPGANLEPRRTSLMDRTDALVAGTAAEGGALAERAAPRPEQGPASAPAPAPSDNQPKFMRRADDVIGQSAVKVDTRKLDNLIDMVGELVIAQSILQENAALVRSGDDRLTRNLAQLRRITGDLQRNAMSMRMVPIRQTFQKMARLVRDLSKKSGKTVDLVLSGEDTELDRRVVEDINDPLMHMVRNSMDHGIEPPEKRMAAGKRAEGRLALSAGHQGGNIVIAIEDDGNGLDSHRILAKATSLGLVQPGESLSDAEINQLIFRPGFSTAEQITDISGRGVGMDVVRKNIDALRGRIEIQTTPGEGTTFLIKLPLTLAILDGLVLGVGAQRFVMPTSAVQESLRPVPEQVHSLKGRPRMILVRGKLVPLAWLSELYRIPGQETDACRGIVVVIEDDGYQVGLVVDELVGKQEVVIKSLGDAFGQIDGVAGGAILGDGQVGLILDAHGIVDRMRGECATAA